MKKRNVVYVIGSFIIGAVTGVVGMKHMMDKEVMEKQQLSDKHLSLFLMMNEWVRIKQQGKNIGDYFYERGWKRIAVYGMSYAGETLVQELESSNIEIVYGIDKSAEKVYADFDILSADDELEEVDAIVVTAITYFDNIREKLKAKVSCPIISLEEILDEM